MPLLSSFWLVRCLADSQGLFVVASFANAVLALFASWLVPFLMHLAAGFSLVTLLSEELNAVGPRVLGPQPSRHAVNDGSPLLSGRGCASVMPLNPVGLALLLPMLGGA